MMAGAPKSRVLRVLLCALSIGAGGGLAELQAVARAKAARADVVREAPVTARAKRTPLALTRTAGELAPLPDSAVLAPEPRSRSGLGEAYRDGAIISGATPHRLILFTFDDGPDRRTTPLLLDRLDEHGVRAVFFLVGSRIDDTTPVERQEAAIAREIVRRGHLVGNHTRDHAQLPLLDEEHALEQIVSAEQTFERVFGARPWLFRPPFGAHSQRIDGLLAERGYTTLLWNLGSGDFQVRSADEVFDTWLKVFERRELDTGDRGGVILLHDTYAWSVDAFERIVSYLRGRNCALLASDEELYDFVDDPSFFFVPRADAPPDTVAPPALLDEATLQARQDRLRESETLRCSALVN